MVIILKRAIFIRAGKNRKFSFLRPILICGLMFYILFFTFEIITLNDIKSFFQKSTGEFVYSMTINQMKKNYKLVDYKYYSKEKKTVAETVIDNINKSIFYYSYLEENVKKNYLVVYDPNKLDASDEQKPTELASNEEPTSSVANNDNEIDSVAVNSSGVMQLKGLGTGPVYSLDQLNNFNFLLTNFYVVPSRAAVYDSDLKAENLLGMDMSIKKDSSVPQILIYHTHSMEGFSDSTQGDPAKSIVAIGTYLAELLSKGYGYNVIHCTESFDYVNGKLDRSKAYTYSRPTLEQILADNPSIEVVLDVHRDGVKEDLHLVTEVNGKKTSQIMFFNGMSRTKAGGDISYLFNKYRSQNLAFSLQMKLIAEQYFPGFTRKNYLDAYQYNLDLRERSVLIEVGAQTNTFEEAKNAMEPLAAILDKELNPSGVSDDGI